MQKHIITEDREEIEWTNTWIEKAQDLECERVLLIGASSAREYRRSLQKIMGKPVDYIGTSLLWMDHDFYNIFESFFKSDYKHSLILLDLGLHSSYNTKDNAEQRNFYEKCLINFVKYLEEKTERVILLSTKPVKCADNPNKYNDASNQEIVSRNNIEKGIADKYGFQYIDTYNYIYNNDFVYRDHAHFAEDGAKMSVARYIYNDIVGLIPIEPKIYYFSEKLPFVAEGLSLPESWGCWSDGRITSFFLRTNNECSAEFNFIVFFAKKRTKQSVTVYVNDCEQGKYVFESGKEFPKIIIDLPKSEKIHIMFKYEDVKSPKELGISDDTRKLAIGFKSMEIKNKQ